MGAATVEPKPASSITATTTYRGSSAGASAANREVSALPSTWAVPVLPATGTRSSGNPANAAAAVPSRVPTARCNPAITACSAAGSSPAGDRAWRREGESSASTWGAGGARPVARVA